MPRIRSGEPIRRSSLEKGTFEAGWYSPIPQADARRLVVAAERHERHSRQPGQRAGLIGTTGLELLGLFLRLQQSSPLGRLDPSYLWISRTLRRSIDAVARGIGKLVDVGLLERMRRVERTEEEDGPVWRQATNAYRICRPAWLVAVLPAVMQPVPPPADYDHSRAATAEVSAAMVRELDHASWAATEFADPGLAASFARCRAALQTRDSAERRESPRRSPPSEDCGVALTGDNSNPSPAPLAPKGAAGGRTAKAGPP